MSFHRYNAIVDQHLATLPAMPLKVLLVFLRYANGDGISFPGVELIASQAGMSPRNARRAREYLVEHGLLVRESVGGGRGHVTLYRISIGKTGAQIAPDCDPEVSEENRGANPTETRAQCAPDSEGETGAQYDTKQGRNTTLNRGATRQETGAQCAPRTIKRTIILTDKRTGEDVEIPPALDTPEFRAALNAWHQHLKEKRHPATPTAQKQQMKRMEQWGLKRAIAALEHSTANGWQGLYEPKGSANANGNGKHHRSAEDRGEFPEPGLKLRPLFPALQTGSGV